MSEQFFRSDARRSNPRGPRRRDVLMGLGAGAAALASPAILRAQTPSTLTVPNSGGALEEAYRVAFFDTFKAKTGIEILGAPYMETARVKAMVDANAVDVDVLNVDFAEAAVMARMGLLEPIDYGVVDRDQIAGWAAQDHYVVTDVAALVMAWNTRTFDADTRPKNWAEYFDPDASPGQRSLWKLAPQTVEVACLGAGVAPADLYPLNLDAAFEAMSRIRDDLTWWTSGAQSAQLLISNEVDMGTAWNGRLFAPKNEGAAIDYTFDNCIYSCDAFIVPKGAKNPEQSMQFIANLMDAQNQATLARNIPYGPTNPAAFEMLEPEVLALLPNSPENGDTGTLLDVDFWAENGDEIFARFNAWAM